MANGREDLRLVVIHERDFQKYSVDRRIYCVPVCVLSPLKIGEVSLVETMADNNLLFCREYLTLTACYSMQG